MDNELGQVKADIAVAKAEIAEAKAEKDFERRNRLEEYLLELQKEKNRLSQPAGIAIYKTPIC